MIGSMVVVSVGTDHHPFDRLVQWTERWADQFPERKVVLQRGTSKAPGQLESHELIPHEELRNLFRDATAVVSHGGPSTVMDARMAGKLPIVAARDPKLGEHVDDHQMRFAEHLARYDLARLVKTEAEFHEALAHAMDCPEDFEIPLQETVASAGVVKFGEVVDALLGIETKLTLYELGGVEQREADRRDESERRARERRNGER